MKYVIEHKDIVVTKTTKIFSIAMLLSICCYFPYAYADTHDTTVAEQPAIIGYSDGSDDGAKIDGDMKPDDGAKIGGDMKSDDSAKIDGDVKPDDSAKIDGDVKPDDGAKIDGDVKPDDGTKLD